MSQLYAKVVCTLKKKERKKGEKRENDTKGKPRDEKEIRTYITCILKVLVLTLESDNLLYGTTKKAHKQVLKALFVE